MMPWRLNWTVGEAGVVAVGSAAMGGTEKEGCWKERLLMSPVCTKEQGRGDAGWLGSVDGGDAAMSGLDGSGGEAAEATSAAVVNSEKAVALE